MATCQLCSCDNYREELFAAPDKMITAAGNCSNCQHPVNNHARRPAFGVVASAPALGPPSVTATTITSMSPSIEKVSEYQGQVVYASAVHLESHSTQHMPAYNPSRGGYVTGTGVNGDSIGNMNNYGNSGVGVNNIPDEVGTVAYGGALGAPYGNDPYSVTRTSRSVVHPPSSTSSSTSSSAAPSQSHTISSADLSAAYGDPYSVKRI